MKWQSAVRNAFAVTDAAVETNIQDMSRLSPEPGSRIQTNLCVDIVTYSVQRQYFHYVHGYERESVLVVR
jgi:hypothetical protein